MHELRAETVHILCSAILLSLYRPDSYKNCQGWPWVSGCTVLDGKTNGWWIDLDGSVIASTQNSDIDSKSTRFDDSFCLYPADIHKLARDKGKEHKIWRDKRVEDRF